MRRAGRDLLDGDSVQADNLLGFGDGPGRVALAALSHRVVAPGVHFVIWTEDGDDQQVAVRKMKKEKKSKHPQLNNSSSGCDLSRELEKYADNTLHSHTGSLIFNPRIGLRKTKGA